MAEPEEVTQIAETYIHRETGVDRAVPWVRDGGHSHNLQGSTKPNKVCIERYSIYSRILFAVFALSSIYFMHLPMRK